MEVVSGEGNTTAPSALVVEGGAMRGIFAAGVLDAFLAENFMDFDFTVGVSAGSTNLIGYLAGDYGRNHTVITGHACRPEFINWRRFLRGGHLCDVGWLWHQSYRDVALNFERYLSQGIPLWVGTTAIETGTPRYYRIDADNLHDVFTASCSIPVAYRTFPEVDGLPMTDGGIADSIPVEWAYEQGARDITVVLSRPQGFRKQPSRFPALMRPLFREHPALYQAVVSRAARYNATLDFIESPPDGCRVRVVAPPEDFPVGRLTTDAEKLETGYQQGVRAARRYLGVPLGSQADASPDTPDLPAGGVSRPEERPAAR
ncbi:patatin-like phospholipase family protein [Marinobacter bohaiensis]|uniref:patatin-like phospholipase family protein n=1 Tax=Marinobacter bohaiensis TaxID=2201898 RepID=UPI000DACE0E2|nr:patatin family protein [Marinobacter bohaiensis]